MIDTQLYSRNIQIDGFGEEGQTRLQQSRVLVIGSGGLGSPVLLYLAAAGVGTLGIVDDDKVELSNLQRQIIHSAADVGMDKVASACRKLRALAPDIALNTYNERFTEANAVALIAKYDFVVDCSDNYDTKFLIDDVCVQLQKPYSHGSVVAMRGEVLTYTPGNACYRDVFGEAPAAAESVTAAQVGVLGAVVGIVGSIQATEALKYLVGMEGLLTNRMLMIDGRTMQFYSLKISPLSR